MFNTFNKKIIWTTIFFIVFFAVFCVIVFLVNRNKIILGTTVAGQSYQQLSFEEAAKKLTGQIKRYEEIPLAVSFKSKTISVLPRDLGITFLQQETLKNLQKLGHQGPILKQIKQQLSSLFFTKNKRINTSFDQEKLRRFLQENFAKFEDLPQDASVEFNPQTKTVYLIPSKSGQILNREEFLQKIFSEAPLLALQKIDLRLIKKEPIISSSQAQNSFLLAKEIIQNSPLILNLADKSWKIKAAEIFSWFNFEDVSWQDFLKIQKSIYKNKQNTPPLKNSENNGKKILWLYFDSEKIKDMLASLAPSINQPAINARLKNTETGVEISKKSQPAVTLNITKSAQIIESALYQGQAEIELFSEIMPARISEKSLPDLGFLDFLGTGYSNFAGSPSSRQHNIKIGTAKFDGILVGPGEEFSFNTLLGEVDAASGYLPELVIKKNKTTPEYGGGLCQVSTTIFRAAVNSGLEITERFPHAFPVRYYNPQGFDATIYPPHPDLRFKNDTPKNILIQANLSGTEISFDIFGTKDGREVKVKGPYIYEKNEDGSLKAVLTQEIWRDNKLERKKVFYSTYKSPALYPIEKNPLE